jgi:hypothetical protein
VLLLVKTPRGSRFVLLALEPEEEG